MYFFVAAIILNPPHIFSNFSFISLNIYFPLFLSKTLILTSVLFIINIGITAACEIDVTVVSGEKEKYSVGDELVIKVKVTLTHRVCTSDIKQTKFDVKGIKILSATDWKELSPGVYERKLKVKVTGTKSGKLKFSATRTCDKTGGFGTINLIAEPIKK